MTADFMTSESPRYVGRVVVALASDPKAIEKTGRVFSSWALAKEYKFTDLDGTRPDWGGYARKRYGKIQSLRREVLFLLDTRLGRDDFSGLVLNNQRMLQRLQNPRRLVPRKC